MASSASEYLDMNMDECVDCLSESGLCDAGCGTALSAVLNSSSLKFFIAIELFLTDSPQTYMSNTGPPDPFPPRSSNLI